MKEDSMPFSTGWNGKLMPKSKPGFKEMKKTINQFNRDDIFCHDTTEFKDKCSAYVLFIKEYGDNTKQPKRPPNSFMMMKSVVKVIADDKKINCKDGKYLSQMCGLIWKGSSPEEKSKFRSIAIEFASYHKKKFNYKYSPPKKSSKNRGTVVEVKTPKDYQVGQVNEATLQLGMTIQNLVDHQASHQEMVYDRQEMDEEEDLVDRQELDEEEDLVDRQASHQEMVNLIDRQASHQLDDEMAYDDLQGSTFPNGMTQLGENQASTLSYGFNEMMISEEMLNGFSPFPSYPLESSEPTIAVNCPPLDPNARQTTPIVCNNHPLNPSSTFFGNRSMNMQYFKKY